MGFNFFKKAEVVTGNRVDNGPEGVVAIEGKKELTEVERDILMQVRNEKEILDNELDSIVESGGNDATEENGESKKVKKDKTWIKKIGKEFGIVCCAGSIAMGAIGCGHADRRAFIDLAQAAVLPNNLTLAETNQFRKMGVQEQKKRMNDAFKKQRDRAKQFTKAEERVIQKEIDEIERCRCSNEEKMRRLNNLEIKYRLN